MYSGTCLIQHAAASNKVYQLLAHGRWFSPASSITETGRHDIAEILLKAALNTKNQSLKSNPTHQVTREMCRIVQNVRILRF